MFGPVDPRALNWQSGDMPPVEKVGWGSYAVVFEATGYIGIVSPGGNELNPLRWGDDSGMPRWGYGAPSGVWAWLLETSDPRPEYVQTRKEMFGDDKD